jgi:hypothetical protein
MVSAGGPSYEQLAVQNAELKRVVAALTEQVAELSD